MDDLLVVADPEESEESEGIDFSTELGKRLRLLSRVQRSAILAIVAAEVKNISPSRLIQSSRSCRWCGRDVRNKEEHEEGCEKSASQPWVFICSHSTWYRWKKEADFMVCLAMAYEEAGSLAIQSSLKNLALATAEAAVELRRQVTDGIRDRDKLNAALAVLDRAARWLSTGFGLGRGRAVGGWRDEVRQLLQAGKVDRKDIEEILGSDLAGEFFEGDKGD